MDDMTQATFTTLEGKEVSLADYKGKKVYLKFWASWCPICLSGLADITQLSEMPPKDSVILNCHCTWCEPREIFRGLQKMV